MLVNRSLIAPYFRLIFKNLKNLYCLEIVLWLGLMDYLLGSFIHLLNFMIRSLKAPRNLFLLINLYYINFDSFFEYFSFI